MRPISIAVFGHEPMDQIKMAGGLLAKYGNEHTKTAISMLKTDNKAELLTPGKFDHLTTPEEVLDEIKKEARQAYQVLGTNAEFLDYDRMKLSNLNVDAEAITEIVDIIRKVRADIVITHWPEDISYGSHHHCSTGIAVTKACYYAPRDYFVTKHDPYAPACLLYSLCDFFSPVANADFKPDIFIDITNEAKKKYEALCKFAHVGIPAPSITRSSRMVQSRYFGIQSGCMYAEGFKWSMRHNYKLCLNKIPEEWFEEGHHEKLALPISFDGYTI